MGRIGNVILLAGDDGVVLIDTSAGGPKPPAGKEANWIQAASGRGWFPMFRFYAPEKSFFEKTWKLLDIEKAK